MSILGTPKKRLTALVAVVAIVAAGSGLAYAYWTATGSGVGGATTGAATDFTVSSSPPVGDPLTPGGPGQSIAFTIANTGSASENLSSVVVSVANSNGTDWVATPGCSALDYTVDTPTIVYGEIAGGAEIDGTVTITMNDLATDQDACQGVPVPLYFLAS